ncbi:enhanced serine sensitivity protein SseB [Lacticaseibacillus zeae]|uniref:Enhanced serine sensitivity protein SseB n=2 Tax=Lacticaseibacillus zeae TaxID=57037 RepID=A0A5R8M037_LACZE|nr:enhanced serine sensitivity protein SseB C-terminal domain-containing protein [Lacticaseibacillus zeae]OLS11382.1 SseB protein [Lacticaseibacillus casei]QVI30911.1 enhanced serine sensitivity protein SseB [Lacticaseibacillus zeae]TLF41117.1 enhanced serine sensitivity protein SseB [Lacticaseibacillus zeae]TLF42880.1 enhanced serine sensitivity protein SseB [Lacticaseibacillus zeae]
MTNEPQVQNPQLIHLMRLLRTDQNDETQAAFYAGLKSAKFMLPVGTARTGDPTVVMLTDDNGHDYLPIFTDQANFAKSPDHDHFAVATIADCANFLYEDRDIFGVVINPYDENMVLSRANLFYVAKPDQAKHGEAVRISEPPRETADLVEQLREYLPKMPTVHAAYLVTMIRADDAQSLLLVVDADKDADLHALVGFAEAYLPETQQFHVSPTDNELGRYVSGEFSPFYQR